jgi:hypothetical protein
VAGGGDVAGLGAGLGDGGGGLGLGVGVGRGVRVGAGRGVRRVRDGAGREVLAVAGPVDRIRDGVTDAAALAVPRRAAVGSADRRGAGRDGETRGRAVLPPGAVLAPVYFGFPAGACTDGDGAGWSAR